MGIGATIRMPLQTSSAAPKLEYTAMKYERLLGTRGFSDEMLQTHFGLYEGYVKQTNKCTDFLRTGTPDPYAAGEVRRRFGWEFNGMRLHELYFDGMLSGGRELASDSPLANAIVAEFGSSEEWHRLFASVANLRGIGWAVLAHDPVGNRLINTWINEHDAGALAGTHPLLVLDVFEHAYMRDYNTDRAGYIKAFTSAIDWSVCDSRLRGSVRSLPTVTTNH